MQGDLIRTQIQETILSIYMVNNLQNHDQEVQEHGLWILNCIQIIVQT